VANPVVLAGDIHSAWFNELRVDFDDYDAPPVAVEFVGTSISSDFAAEHDAVLKLANPQLNPHVRFFDGLRRGYLRCELGRDAWRTDLRVVATTDAPEAPVTTRVSYVTEAGTHRLVPD
jgi:alkaline phosphatase D